MRGLPEAHRSGGGRRLAGMSSSPNTYPVALQIPDIAPYRRGNMPVDYVHRFKTGVGGPHVLVTALVHGNEICGAIALDWLLKQKLRPVRGTLTLAFCNVAAFQRFDVDAPNESRFVDEDLNRVWSPRRLDGPGNSVELRRARELRAIVDAADALLDIHSMQHPTEPLIIAGPLEKGRTLAAEIGVPALVVRDEGHAAGRRMRDYGGFGDPESEKNAMLVECGQHWEPKSEVVAKDVLVRFLSRYNIVDPAWVKRHLPSAKPPPQRTIEITDAVTISSDRFRFVAEYKGLEVIARGGTIIALDDARPVSTPYDNCVLVMPSRRLARGETAVRLGRYVP
jgi:predicted deacylase